MELRLKEILKSRNLTLKAFSEKSGISQPNLSNYINGNVSPTLDMLNRIASCLDIEVVELLSEQHTIEFYIKQDGRLFEITRQDIQSIINKKINSE